MAVACSRRALLAPKRWRWQLALLAFAGGVTPQRTGRRLVFELHRHRVPSGRTSSLESLRRLQPGVSIPAVTPVAPAQASVAVPLSNSDNIQYHLQIQIGSPCPGAPAANQKFSIIPDTGSADLWVPSASCQACATGLNKYDSTKSCTAKILGDNSTFRYGDGTHVSGTGVQDTVTVGTLAVQNQFFLQVNAVQEQSGMTFGGILGLSHHRAGYTLQDPNRHTFIRSMFEEHPELPRQFSFFLSGLTETAPSQLVFGDPDMAAHAKEPFRFTKSYHAKGVDTWLASMRSIGWSGTGWLIDFPDMGAVGALVDSGSSLMVLRPDVYDQMTHKLWKFLPGCSDQGNGMESCSCPVTNASAPSAPGPILPDLVLTFVDETGVGFNLCMTPEEYLIESETFGVKKCTPTFQRGDADQPTPVILGMTFMRSFYTTFDVTSQRVGFARSSRSPVAASRQCHVGFSIWRIITLQRVLWVSAFIFAVLGGCLCGCFVFPYCCCDDEVKGEEETGLVDAQSSQASQPSQASQEDAKTDVEDAEDPQSGLCGF